MIVYGDPHFRAGLLELVAHLRARLAVTQAVLNRVEMEQPDQADAALAELRTLMILAGQLEQAAADGLPAARVGDLWRLRQATAHAASAFYSLWSKQQPTVQRKSAYAKARLQARDGLAAMAETLAGDFADTPTPLHIKMPEGFAFYALYPEQYCLAAQRWLADHHGDADAPTRHAVVVGIRSIGTTLAAVVRAALHGGGWRAHSLTVRPTGHPFERHVDIAPADVAHATWALVVDEGPGLSGSSMAAVAEALLRAGMSRECIAFLPGHNGQPGSAASDAVRRWWATTPRYVASPADLRFNGLALPDALAAATQGLLTEHDAVSQVEDFGGGLWRNVVYTDRAQWPAACAPFERPKYRCTTARGFKVVWKFAGLAGDSADGHSAAEHELALLSKRTVSGPRPLGIAHGFIALEWIEGVPLTRAELSDDLVAQMGQHIAAVAGPALSRAEQQAAQDRLAELLYWNAWEALGEAQAGRIMAWVERARRAFPPSTHSYGDRHIAAHEWLREPDGAIVKVDSSGHSMDHTAVGQQSVAWDLAGAIVEWDMDESRTAALLCAFEDAGGGAVSPDVLTFHRMAYAAFRLGQCALCANMSAHDPAEQARLWQAHTRYRDELALLLSRIQN